MILSRSLLTLLALSITAAAAGPAAVAHEILKGSIPILHENNSNGASDIIRPKAEATLDQHGPGLGVMQEAARKVLPPPLWAALFQETLFSPDGGSEARAQMQPRINWLQMLAPYYLPNITMVSPECRRDINAISDGLINNKSWAQSMVDSWGKFSDGVLVGNVRMMGLLDECLMTTVDSQDPEAHFRGQYCAFSFKNKPKSINEERLALEEGDDEREEEEEEEMEMMLPHLRVANVKGMIKGAAPFNLMATCIPSTCTREEYMESLEEQLNHRNMETSMVECQTKDLPSLRYNAADIIMIITLTLLGIMVLVGTLADVWIFISKNEEAAQGPIRYFRVFSFYTNLSKIFHINVKESEEVISCLHGIRVLSMCWVVLCHAYIYSALTSANMLLVGQMISEHPYLYQVILNGYSSVDTFFFMSGLLVAYNLTKVFQRTSKFNVPLYYIHRFIRLAPPIMLLCGFFAVFPPLFVQGSVSPLLVRKDNLVDYCIRYWWKDSFFLTNLFDDAVDGKSCLPVSWYIAVDFQLYIVTPLMFLPLLYRRRLGMVVLGGFVVASVIVPMTIIGVNHLTPTSVMDTTPQASQEYMKWVYMKPWCRASPYLVGVVLGYFLRMVDKEKMQFTRWQAALGWVAALATITAVIFGLKDYNTLSGHPHEYVPAISILYGGLHRLAWGAAIAWLVFACHMGYGGPVNSLLSHPFWQPMSRLTYTVFLIALNTQNIYYNYYSRLPIYFTPFYKLTEVAGILLISTCGGLLLSLLAESPVLGLEKLLLRKPQ